MSTARLGLGAALLLIGCTPIDPASNTFPQNPEPTQVAGPPGGQMDPGYGYQPQQAQETPDQPGYPQGYEPATEDQASADTANPEPSEDPGQAGYDTGEVNDAEIDATLDGYGSWEDSDDYGRVWRPDATTVGVDFTPYETGGSWVWSDAGWSFNCDSYGWGWLPFHYGRWGWFDGYWGWQPGHRWTAGAVEWRGGGGYTGWRPLTPIIRDHRGQGGQGGQGGQVRDHRSVVAHDSQWRFASDKDFGHGHIAGHLFQNPAEGLRVTSPVQKPSLRGNYSPVATSSLMRGRLQGTYSRSQRINGGNNITRAQEAPRQQSFRSQQPAYRGNETPTWRPQQQYRAPQQQSYRAPQQGYRPAYRPPAQTNNYRSYNAPSRTYNAPSRSYSTPSRSYGGFSWHSSPAPSHSSSFSSHSSGGGGSHSSGGGGGGHSSGGGGGGHSGGGGGHRR